METKTVHGVLLPLFDQLPEVFEQSDFDML